MTVLPAASFRIYLSVSKGHDFGPVASDIKTTYARLGVLKNPTNTMIAVFQGLQTHGDPPLPRPTCSYVDPRLL